MNQQKNPLCVLHIEGSRHQRKEWILQYCLKYGLQKRIWLIDTIGVFDPYAMSRINTSLARRVLDRMKVSRPFTFHQLERKLYGLSKISLTQEDVIIISGIDCFESVPSLDIIHHEEVIIGWEELSHQYATKWKNNFVNLRSIFSPCEKKTKNTLRNSMLMS